MAADLAVDKVHERSAGHVLHDDVDHLADEDGLQQVDDVGVLQVGQDVDLFLDLLDLADVPEVARIHLLDSVPFASPPLKPPIA